MSRLVAILLVLAAPPVLAEPLDAPDDDLAEHAIAAQVGLATGSRVTPGGFRVTGHFLYQLSSRDWFDGTAAFTFGGGDAACFRDRDNVIVCDHGLAAGKGIELGVGVRRMFARQGTFRPFVRAGLGVGLARFSSDSLTGLAIPAYVGLGMRAKVRPAISVVVEAGASVGVGIFTRGLGSEPILGAAVTAGAEFDL